mmetsp:Transcript_7764/g.13322  ORF Transcript_7764/g.13322 Transcript_7764/m.13322 type:complete len:327 (+) Transcript_7764:314-1294(+)
MVPRDDPPAPNHDHRHRFLQGGYGVGVLAFGRVHALPHRGPEAGRPAADRERVRPHAAQVHQGQPRRPAGPHCDHEEQRARGRVQPGGAAGGAHLPRCVRQDRADVPPGHLHPRHREDEPHPPLPRRAASPRQRDAELSERASGDGGGHSGGRQAQPRVLPGPPPVQHRAVADDQVQRAVHVGGDGPRPHRETRPHALRPLLQLDRDNPCSSARQVCREVRPAAQWRPRRRCGSRAVLPSRPSGQDHRRPLHALNAPFSPPSAHPKLRTSHLYRRQSSPPSQALAHWLRKHASDTPPRDLSLMPAVRFTSHPCFAPSSPAGMSSHV